MNEATGGVGGGTTAGVLAGGGVTVNVTGSLQPGGFPSELSCVATAVYSPLGRVGLASPDVQPAPVPVAVAIETTVPFSVAPAWIWTVTGVMSLAVPVNDGVVLSDGVSGGSNVTVGAAVSTVNVTGELVPVSDAVCVACAV